MSDVELGTAPQFDSKRDAIHVAVVPLRAAELLMPGQRVGLVGEGQVGSGSATVGIVDPFLTDVVRKGSECWVCLLPGTVTGMRHHWQHPAFREGLTSPDKAEAEEWLRDQCDELGVCFEDLVDVDHDLCCGEFVLSPNNESARDHWYAIEDDFWRYHEIYTGEKIPEKRRGGFTCSC